MNRLFPSNNLNVFENGSELAQYATKEILKQPPYAPQTEIHIALSGGSTPNAVYDLLAQEKELINKPIHYWWGDERWVASTHKESNYRQAKERFIDPLKLDSRYIHPILKQNSPPEDAETYTAQLKEMVPTHEGLPVFDWVLLGMGADGHVASLFPNEWDPSTKETTVHAHHPESGQDRISLSMATILAARRITLFITGDAKAAPLGEIFNENKRAKKYPANYLFEHPHPVEWCLDKKAARDIK